MDDLLIRCNNKNENYTVIQDQNHPDETRIGGAVYSASAMLSLEVVESKSRCKVYLTPAKALAISEWITEWLKECEPILAQILARQERLKAARIEREAQEAFGQKGR